MTTRQRIILAFAANAAWLPVFTDGIYHIIGLHIYIYIYIRVCVYIYIYIYTHVIGIYGIMIDILYYRIL